MYKKFNGIFSALLCKVSCLSWVHSNNIRIELSGRYIVLRPGCDMHWKFSQMKIVKWCIFNTLSPMSKVFFSRNGGCSSPDANARISSVWIPLCEMNNSEKCSPFGWIPQVGLALLSVYSPSSFAPQTPPPRRVMPQRERKKNSLKQGGGRENSTEVPATDKTYFRDFS